MIWGYPHFRLGHLHMGIAGWFMVGNPSIWVNYNISLTWIVRPWMGMISLIINGWELGALWLRKPPQISQISKGCWEMWNSQNGEDFDAKKSEAHPQKSMLKEICPQSWGNDRNWMLKLFENSWLEPGTRVQKKYTNSTDSHHFPTFFACWYLVVGTQKNPPFERTPICCRNPAAARRSWICCNDCEKSR